MFILFKGSKAEMAGEFKMLETAYKAQYGLTELPDDVNIVEVNGFENMSNLRFVDGVVTELTDEQVLEEERTEEERKKEEETRKQQEVSIQSMEDVEGIRQTFINNFVVADILGNEEVKEQIREEYYKFKSGNAVYVPRCPICLGEVNENSLCVNEECFCSKND